MEGGNKEGKIRIALAGLFEEVNTFADETMGKAKITGNMTTGFQQWTDKALIDDYKGSHCVCMGRALPKASTMRRRT
jgi:hypothetical protein